MKKIMFNDRYGLTQAVLEGSKTMTRRIVPAKLVRAIVGGAPGFAVMESRYKVGEVVAVAQNYKDAGLDPKNCDKFQLVVYGDFPPRHRHGWTNKMFVSADLMPHQIRITNVKVERLQDISDEDCIREGISFMPGGYYVNYRRGPLGRDWLSDKSYRSAFAALIDKVSGKGTWASNPYVFVYEFELVK